MEGKAKPQITRNDVTKAFRKKRLFMGQRYHRMEDQKSGFWILENWILQKRKGLEPKVKKFSNIALVGRRDEQT